MTSLKAQLKKSIDLAHINLTEKEEAGLVSDLSKIVDFVKIIDETEKKNRQNDADQLSKEEKDYPQLTKKNVFREDVIDPFPNKEELLAVVPEKKNNLIKVKKI